MHNKHLIFMPLIFMASAANANDNIGDGAKETEWTVGISGGVAIIEGSSDQTFGSISINKEIGDSYVGFALSHIDSGNVPGLINNIPASTTQGTLSAGTSFDALNFDGYLSYGKRNFDTESLARNGRRVNINSDGDSFGIGLTMSYDFVLDDKTFLTPAVSVDYNEIDIARAVIAPSGQQIGISNSENGVTGSFGLAVQRLFGGDEDHLISLLGNIVTTSNTTSFNPGNTQSAVLRALAQRDEPGQKDSWGEVGASLSLALNKNLRMDFSIIQTVGFLNSDATSISTGLRHSF